MEAKTFLKFTVRVALAFAVMNLTLKLAERITGIPVSAWFYNPETIIPLPA